jgi:streptogramin lyase
MIAAGSGSIWVFTHRSVYAYRIDPSTNRIVAKVDVHDTPCTLASAGDGLVWNSNCGPAESSIGVSFAINPRTDRVTRRIRGNYPAFGAGSLWVLNDSGSAVRRVDPQSGVVLASIPTGIDEQPGGGTLEIGGVGHGSVWLASDSAKSVTRISTATNKVTDVITLTGAKTEDEAFPQAAEQDNGYINGASVAFTPGRAWYANPAGLFEIDAHTNRARRISFGMRPFTNWGDDTVVSGAGSVWLRTTNNTIDRIDPANGKVQGVYPAGMEGGGGDITVAFGSLWVDNAGSDSVWREPIRNG